MPATPLSSTEKQIARVSAAAAAAAATIARGSSITDLSREQRTSATVARAASLHAERPPGADATSLRLAILGRAAEAAEQQAGTPASPSSQPGGWASAFLADSEAALQRLVLGKACVILIAIEASNTASLALIRNAWRQPQLQQLLRDGRCIALRYEETHPEASFWKVEFALSTMPTVLVLYGERGASFLRSPSQLTADVICTRVRAALGEPGAYMRQRGAVLLAHYLSMRTRGFDMASGRLDQTGGSSTQSERERVIAEQEAEFAASLLADEAESAAEQAALLATQSEERRERELAERRQERLAKAANLPAEGDETSTQVVVRLPDGRKRSRRFPPSTALQLVADWVESDQPDIPDFQLVSTFPRLVIGPEHLASTLLELGMHPAVSLYLSVGEDSD